MTEPLGKAPDVNVGFTDSTLLVVSALGFVALAGTIYTVVIRRLRSSDEIVVDDDDPHGSYDEQLAHSDVATLNRAQRRARAKHIMKQQRKTNIPTPQPQEPTDEPIPPAANNPAERSTLSRKQRQLKAKEVEREERQLLDSERRREQAQAEQLARKQRQERERLEAEQAERDRQQRLSQKLMEEELAKKRYQTFLSSPDEGVSLSVDDWLEEMRTQRVVQIPQLAERFRLEPQYVTDRIQELVASSRVTGVMEPDGRFIFVSHQELKQLATFMSAREKTTASVVVQHAEYIISATSTS